MLRPVPTRQIFPRRASRWQNRAIERRSIHATLSAPSRCVSSANWLYPARSTFHFNCQHLDTSSIGILDDRQRNGRCDVSPRIVSVNVAKVFQSKQFVDLRLACTVKSIIVLRVLSWKRKKKTKFKRAFVFEKIKLEQFYQFKSSGPERTKQLPNFLAGQRRGRNSSSRRDDRCVYVCTRCGARARGGKREEER